MRAPPRIATLLMGGIIAPARVGTAPTGTAIALPEAPYFQGVPMATQYRSDTTSTYATAGVEPEASAVSWAAVLAGAAAAAALSLILVVLGTGLGLSSLSPWTNEGANAKALGISTA